MRLSAKERIAELNRLINYYTGQDEEARRELGITDEEAHRRLGIALATALRASYEEVEAAVAHSEKAEREIKSIREATPGSYEWLNKHREQARVRTRMRGYEPGRLQWQWRTDPPDVYSSAEVEDAICDALNEMGGTAAWPGDGVGCVEQIVRKQAEKADALQSQMGQFKTAAREVIGEWFGDDPDNTPDRGSNFPWIDRMTRAILRLSDAFSPKSPK